MNQKEIEFRNRIQRIAKVQRILEIKNLNDETKDYSNDKNEKKYTKEIMPSIDGIRKSIINFQKENEIADIER